MAMAKAMSSPPSSSLISPFSRQCFLAEAVFALLRGSAQAHASCVSAHRGARESRGGLSAHEQPLLRPPPHMLFNGHSFQEDGSQPAGSGRRPGAVKEGPSLRKCTFG